MMMMMMMTKIYLSRLKMRRPPPNMLGLERALHKMNTFQNARIPKRTHPKTHFAQQALPRTALLCISIF